MNINEKDLRGQVQQAFREMVLTLGGVFATHVIDDELVRTIARSLGRVVDRHLHTAADGPAPAGKSEPAASPPRRHPAIAELLGSIGRPDRTSGTGTDREWLRRAGLFRRWEFEQVIDVDEEFLVEEAGRDEQGMSLFAIYSRPHAGDEGAP